LNAHTAFSRSQRRQQRATARRQLLWGLLAATLLGALHTPAYVLTNLWALPLLCLGAFVALLARLGAHRSGSAFLLGWAFGCGWLCASVWWLFISMHRYGGLAAPLAALAVFALSAALSLYLGLACAMWARWRSEAASAVGRNALLFAGLWLLAELARGLLFTGFPWAAFGYAQLDSPLAAWAPWLGVYGIGALAAWTAARLGLMLGGGRDAPRLGGLLLIVLLFAGGSALQRSELNQFTSSNGSQAVSLIQTNVAQDEKFAAERLPDALAWLVQNLRAAPPGLVVAPETAIPLLPSQLETLQPGLWQSLRRHFASSTERAALVGVPLGDFEAGYTNSAAGFSAAFAAPGAPFWRYDKHHLVPFGEFVPKGFRWFVNMMSIPLGDFARGPLLAPSFPFKGQAYGVNICYEDLFGEELAARFVDETAAPTVLVNLSNIGWFGNTVALPQHLNITRMRTLELQRPMLRSTNTGVTALVDHQGRVQAQLPPFTRGVLQVSVEGRKGSTPYARWAGRFGLWPLVALAALLAALCALAQRPSDR
jgi:apolipoprotein N-acyltransferase